MSQPARARTVSWRLGSWKGILTVQQAWYARMFTRYRLRPRSTRAPYCPRTLIGLRCRRHYGFGFEECLCANSRRFGALFDHVRAWTTRDGRRVLTMEPYHIDEPLLAAFRLAIQPLGLTVRHCTYSPYAPGSSQLLMIVGTKVSGRKSRVGRSDLEGWVP